VAAAAATAAADATCQRCGRQFNTYQGRNAHLRCCVGKTDETATTAAVGTTTTTATAAKPREVQDSLGSYWMTYPLGTPIRKRFDDGQYYRGTIIGSGYHYLIRYYQIQYEDGDAEDFTTAEVKRYLMKPEESDLDTLSNLDNRILSKQRKRKADAVKMGVVVGTSSRRSSSSGNMLKQLSCHNRPSKHWK